MKTSPRFFATVLAALVTGMAARAETETAPAEPQVPAEPQAPVEPQAPAEPQAPVEKKDTLPPAIVPGQPESPAPAVTNHHAAVVKPVKTKGPKKILSVSDSVSHQEEWDASLQVFLPDSTYWSSAVGVSAERVNWKWDRLGWGLNLAVAQWDAAGGVLDLPFAKFNDFTMDGSEKTIQLGVLGAYRRPLGDKVSLVLKAGLAYLFTQSDLRVTASYTDYYDRQVSYSILADNVQQLVGRAEMILRRNVIWGKRDMYLQAGIEYQVRLAGDDPGFLQEDLRMSMDAPSLRLGLGWRW